MRCWPALLLVLLLAACDRQDKPAPMVACVDPAAGCRFNVGGREVSLRFGQPITAMAPFDVNVKIAQAREVRATFAMRGMDMGSNQYRLLAANDGNWGAKVMLPVCVQGRRDWIMTLSVDGEAVTVPFSSH